MIFNWLACCDRVHGDWRRRGGCASGLSASESKRSMKMLEATSTIGFARNYDYWAQQALTPETYVGATEQELGSIRARAQILQVEADILSAYMDKADLFKAKAVEPTLANLQD